MKKVLLLVLIVVASVSLGRYILSIGNDQPEYTSFARSKHKFTMNSKEYWDERFRTGDWQSNNGNEQSLHFYTLLVNAIPENIQNELMHNHYTVFDFGCAQGEGTEYFASIFSGADVTGVDISSEAIHIASQKHRKAKFLATDLTGYSGYWDVLISSNTMEHFYQPWDVLQQLAAKTKKYMIILVPFDQPGIPMDEHFYSFNHDNIPKAIDDFALTFSRIVYPDTRHWGEKQILLVYTKQEAHK